MPSESRRLIKQAWQLEAALQPLSQAQLLKELDAARAQLGQERQRGDKSIAQVLAILRSLAHQTVRLRPHDQQLLGALGLYRGNIVEMANGEGKTLAAAIGALLYVLDGTPVHIATYNDYLAERDAQWMGPLYHAAGVQVAVLQPQQRASRLVQEDGQLVLSACSRQDAYACPVVYGQHRDFALDYLNDATSSRREQLVQGSLECIILDEADAALLDLAREKLQIAVAYDQNPLIFRQTFGVAAQLTPPQDFIVNPRAGAIDLTESGVARIERMLNIERLYSTAYPGLAFHIIESLRAVTLFHRDQDYVVLGDAIVPVDTYTGRLNRGSRFNDGLHQAIEVKENLPNITRISAITAEISYQNFFKMYRRMAGLTATAQWRAREFRDVYDKSIAAIPPIKTTRRKELPDLVFKNKDGKLKVLIDDIAEAHARQQPVLIGTLSIEDADEISSLLTLRAVPHNVLHAKYHDREAEIIAAAGQRGAVTVAAKMAGRGTDILLGPGVAELGGLLVIGTDRSESRHIDIHLAGRAGRQGDPGVARFYTSLDSDLMQRFGGAQITSMMEVLDLEDDVALEHAWVTLSIRNAQRKVEDYNLEQRRDAYAADSAIDGQRRLIYGIRRQTLYDQFDEQVEIMIRNSVLNNVDTYAPPNAPDHDWNLLSLVQSTNNIVNGESGSKVSDLAFHTRDEIRERLITGVLGAWKQYRVQHGTDQSRFVASVIVRRALDDGWRRHLARLNSLQSERDMRSYVQDNAWAWYTAQANRVFNEMLREVEAVVAPLLFRA